MTITLPWPPSVNRYWRHARGRTYIGKPGKAYRTAVARVVSRSEMIVGRISLTIIAHPPDNRVRDLDNLLKAPLDALGRAGAYMDDGHIDRLLIERGPADRAGPRLEITIRGIG